MMEMNRRISERDIEGSRLNGYEWGFRERNGFEDVYEGHREMGNGGWEHGGKGRRVWKVVSV